MLSSRLPKKNPTAQGSGLPSDSAESLLYLGPSALRKPVIITGNNDPATNRQIRDTRANSHWWPGYGIPSPVFECGAKCNVECCHVLRRAYFEAKTTLNLVQRVVRWFNVRAHFGGQIGRHFLRQRGQNCFRMLSQPPSAVLAVQGTGFGFVSVDILVSVEVRGRPTPLVVGYGPIRVNLDGLGVLFLCLEILVIRKIFTAFFKVASRIAVGVAVSTVPSGDGSQGLPASNISTIAKMITETTSEAIDIPVLNCMRPF